MLKNLEVYENLAVGFGVLLLLTVIIAATSLNRLSHIKEDVVDNILNDRYPKIALANESIQLTLDNARLIRNAILLTDHEEIESNIRRAEENRKLNSAALEKMEKLLSTPKGRELFKTVSDTRVRLSQGYEPLYKLVRANNDAEATSFLLKEFAPANNAFITALRDLAAFQASLMEKAKEDTTATVASTRTILITAILAALLIGALIGFFISKELSQQIGAVVAQSEKIADGDFSPNTGVAPPAVRTEIGRLMTAQERMRGKLIEALEAVRSNATQVNDSARELASVSEQVAISVQRQADSTSSASATLEELSVSVDHVSDNAKDASSQAAKAGSLAESGTDNVNDSVKNIQSVTLSVQQTSDEMGKLKREVVEIGNIVTVIRDVADQTNLLALNAAIEAARAGESGRGFAVVADEVRKLAERTSKSAHEITQMIHSIQTSAEHAGQSMDMSQQSVKGMVDSAEGTKTMIYQVQESAHYVLGAIDNIDTALAEQRVASQELAKSMEAVAQMAEENSATVEELATTSQVLMSLSNELQTVVGRFRW